jgi:hypothetical protein
MKGLLTHSEAQRMARYMGLMRSREKEEEDEEDEEEILQCGSVERLRSLEGPLPKPW